MKTKPSAAPRRFGASGAFVLLAGALGVACGPEAASAGPVAYKITDLGTLGADSFGTDLNDQGQEVGYSYLSLGGNTHGFVFQNGHRHDIKTLPHAGGESRALGINNAGQIVGDSGGYAFVLSRGTFHRLPSFPGGAGGQATKINDLEEIVGFAYTGQSISTPHPFLYRNHKLIDLGTFGGPDGLASDINNHGDVVGGAAVSDVSAHAFLYHHGHLRDLGTLGGASSTAYAINESGAIVGGADAKDGLMHTFLYQNGKMHDLGSVAAGGSRAQDINDKGQIVGQAFDGFGTDSAFVYTQGKAYDLNTLLPKNSGWDLTDAEAINNTGQIVGTGFSPKGVAQHAYLLTPVANSTPPTLTFAAVAAPAADRGPQSVPLPPALVPAAAMLAGLGLTRLRRRFAPASC